MRRTNTLLALGLGVLALAAGTAGSADATLPPPKGSEPIGSALWPKVAAQLAKNIARASFAHEYERVWGYLHPTYREAVSQSHWHSCQKSHPAAPPNITITKVAVASATEVAVSLSRLGRRNVQDIKLLVQFKTPAAASIQLALLDTFWLKQGKTWTAVWLADEFKSYTAGKCYLTPQGPPLY